MSSQWWSVKRADCWAGWSWRCSECLADADHAHVTALAIQRALDEADRLVIAELEALHRHDMDGCAVPEICGVCTYCEHAVERPCQHHDPEEWRRAEAAYERLWQHMATTCEAIAAPCGLCRAQAACGVGR
jgi:hypothetical protein